MSRRSSAVVAVAVLVPLVASCSGTKDDGRTVEVRGTAVVSGGGRSRTLHDGRHRLAFGDLLRVSDGVAVLDLPGDASIELRADIDKGSVLRVARRPELRQGEALVASAEPIAVTLGSIVASVDGVARLRETTSTTVGVYRGSARLDAGGRHPRITALRQRTIATVAAVPRRSVPLVYDQDAPDPWDRRYLGAAIDVGPQLDRRSAALTRQLPGNAGATPGSLTSLLPVLGRQRGFGPALVSADRSSGETLVGASIALEARRRSFESAWTSAFRFRSAGAPWGLVALDQQARRAAVMSTLDGVLNRSPLRFGTTAAAPLPTTTSTVPPRRPSGSPTTTVLPSPTVPSVPPVTVPPTTVPRPTVPGAPTTTLPSTTLPPATIPSTTLPSLPPTTIPPTTVPPAVKPVTDLIDRIIGR